jgi:hypothetical protein
MKGCYAVVKIFVSKTQRLNSFTSPSHAAMPNAKDIKDARKTIQFIKKTFYPTSAAGAAAFAPPFKILFDAEMIAQLAKKKIPWKKQLEELLPGK